MSAVTRVLRELFEAGVEIADDVTEAVMRRFGDAPDTPANVRAVRQAVQQPARPRAADFVVPRAQTPAQPRRRAPPQVRVDNPGGEWLGHTRRRAEQEVSAGNTTVSGPVTAYLRRPIELDPQKLAVIPGAAGEVRVPGEFQYDRLRPSIEREGFRQDSPILVGINHRGAPYVIEGNTRVAVARDLGIDRIPAEVRYFAGGEQVGGLMEPNLLQHYMPPSELSLDPNFSRWFEGSRGVDEYGEPKMFFHGTRVWPSGGLGDFSTFDRMAAVNQFNRRPGMDAVGSWFSDRPDEQGAQLYSGLQGSEHGYPAIYPVYLRYKNPWQPSSFDEFLDVGNSLVGRAASANPRGGFDPNPLREWLAGSGYDAIQFPRGLDGGDQQAIVMLEPTQIKSATGNLGTYDPNDPDIRKARGGRVNPDRCFCRHPFSAKR